MRVSGKREDGSRVRRVLIYRLGSLGDTVVALPALRLVQRAFPDAERRLLTNIPVASKAPPSAAILEGTGLVQNYMRYEVGLRNPLKLLGLVWRIRRWKPDVLVYLTAARGLDVARRDARFFSLCGIARVVGVPLTEAMQTNLEQPDGLFEREAARLGRCIAELGDARVEDPASWELDLTDAEGAKADAVLSPLAGRPFVAMSLGTKLQVNEWSPESWSELLREMAGLYPNHGLVMVGAKEDVALSESVAEGWRSVAEAGPVVNLCGMLSPRESGAVFARSFLYLGHDSGPLHLAAAAGARCVAIFAARNKPGQWFPYGERRRVIYHRVSCWGCGLLTCIEEGKRCIYSISVREVLDAVHAVTGEMG